MLKLLVRDRVVYDEYAPRLTDEHFRGAAARRALAALREAGGDASVVAGGDDERLVHCSAPSRWSRSTATEAPTTSSRSGRDSKSSRSSIRATPSHAAPEAEPHHRRRLRRSLRQAGRDRRRAPSVASRYPQRRLIEIHAARSLGAEGSPRSAFRTLSRRAEPASDHSRGDLLAVPARDEPPLSLDEVKESITAKGVSAASSRPRTSSKRSRSTTSPRAGGGVPHPGRRPPHDRGHRGDRGPRRGDRRRDPGAHRGRPAEGADQRPGAHVPEGDRQGPPTERSAGDRSRPPYRGRRDVDGAGPAARRGRGQGRSAT